MRPKDYKGRCIKRSVSKSKDVVKTYDKVQTAYLTLLEKDHDIVIIKSNVVLEDIEEGKFTTDFLCETKDGNLKVRECIYRKQLLLPRMCRLLDESRIYWLRRGVTDWGIVVEKEEKKNEEK